ncbi:ribose-phosphate diphosphokinase [Marinobacter sp. SS21]|uniref:ribose-phosphate diphosphokinase n=1 Tax=Marinobacter sp. SS21 TaxID=2979460 RepID=UPI002330D840|nr:ribose-phosphate pyrophosphokinase [Marinobacter sp. SS21]MDC0663766.1 ribose-phosphate pyrophosphokinase [Marinobacter sp. SS21]
MINKGLCLFALDEDDPLPIGIARYLGLPLSPHEERRFDDGEHKCRPLESVRDKDVYIVQSLVSDHHLSVDDRLCRLLFFIATLADASAYRITAVLPYLCYGRKDRQTQSRDPVITRYVAQLFEAVGVSRVLTLDAHNPAAYQNAFRCPREHLEGCQLMADHFASSLRDQDVAVVSPDIGGIKRAERFRQQLTHQLGRNVSNAYVEKYRSSGHITGGTLVGDVEHKTVIILDDLISTGGTLLQAAKACRRHGARAIHGAATHGLFSGNTEQFLTSPELDGLVITDSILPARFSPAADDKLIVLSVAPLLAGAIDRLSSGGSLSELRGQDG